MEGPWTGPEGRRAATTALRENETEGRTCCLKIGEGKVRQKVGPEVSKWRGLERRLRGLNLPPCAVTAEFDIIPANLRKKRWRYGQVNPVAS